MLVMLNLFQHLGILNFFQKYDMVIIGFVDPETSSG